MVALSKRDQLGEASLAKSSLKVIKVYIEVYYIEVYIEVYIEIY